MKLAKQEIEEELAHRKQVLSALIRRRRPLELHEARKGLSTPPEVLTEISSLAEQIRKQEEEIAKLDILAAEGQLSIVEAEYRVMVAKTWDTPRGKPSLAGDAELELARLKMRLLLEKAEQIELAVRVGLAEEVFSNLDADFLGRLPERPKPVVKEMVVAGDIIAGDVIGNHVVMGTSASVTIYNPNFEDPYNISLRIIGRAVRLDESTALRLFLAILPPSFLLDVGRFGAQLLDANRVWNYQNDRETFEQFLQALDSALAEREAAITTN